MPKQTKQKYKYKPRKTRKRSRAGSLDYTKMQSNLDYRHGYEKGIKEYRKYIQDLQTEYDVMKRDFEAEQQYSYQMEEQNINLKKAKEALFKEGQRLINKLKDKKNKLKEENKTLKKLNKQQKGTMRLQELSFKESKKTHVEIGSKEFEDEMLALIKKNKLLKANICKDYINNFTRLKSQIKSLESK